MPGAEGDARVAARRPRVHSRRGKKAPRAALELTRPQTPQFSSAPSQSDRKAEQGFHAEVWLVGRGRWAARAVRKCPHFC